jgi:hypothetical protein
MRTRSSTHAQSCLLNVAGRHTAGGMPTHNPPTRTWLSYSFPSSISHAKRVEETGIADYNGVREIIKAFSTAGHATLQIESGDAH